MFHMPIRRKTISQLYLLSNLHNNDSDPNYKTDQDLVSKFDKQKTVFNKTCANKYDSHNFQ